MRILLLLSLTLISLSYISGLTPLATAQPFNIVSSGELDLDSGLIVADGQVSEYFGMYVNGLGDSLIRVSVGQQSAQKSYEFQLNSTKLFSFLLATDFVDRTSVVFRRGVIGDIKIDLLDSSGNLQDSTTISLNVDLGKKNCKKYPNKNLKTCTKLNLARATKSQSRLFAKVFLSSIKGPIILEP